MSTNDGTTACAVATTRADRIHEALNAHPGVQGHYCQNGMPGRRWTVWGPLVTNAGLGGSRSYSTREVEALLNEATA